MLSWSISKSGMGRRCITSLTILILPLLLFLLSSCSTESYMGRWFIWRNSDIEDYGKFPSTEFHASQSPFQFVENYNASFDNLEVSKKSNKKIGLLELLKESSTTAFLIIRNDTIVYEKYLNGYYRASINTSFSVAKSITGLLTGKAMDEGFINSIDDPVVNYIPELLKTDGNYEDLRISDLLSMKSGIQFRDHDLPWGDKPKAYYKPDLRVRIMELPMTDTPGDKFKYNSYNPIVLGMVIEKSTKLSPASYFEEQIWNKMGMEYSGSWSMDSEESGMTKMESGLNLRAVDFAKFGRLILKRGNWDGTQIISDNWIEELYSVSEINKVEEFGDEIFYKNFWWIYSKDQENSDIISGWGHLGQFLYVFPKTNTIIVRMGSKTGNVESWGKIIREVESTF